MALAFSKTSAKTRPKGMDRGRSSMTEADAILTKADSILARAAWRLIPIMCLMYVVSFLDRSNVGFAALTMNRDLGLSPEVYGIGSGIFFWGYFFFEVPSNLALEKVGARAWMCRIMVTWGLLSMACAFVQGALSFYVLRFLLGAAEAGLYPGMILYMTYWFPQATRARFIALFLAAVPAASVIGGPISGWLLDFEGAFHGWQWMFLLEGIPSVLLGIAVLWLLPDRPSSATWLTQEEKEILTARLAADQLDDARGGALHGFWEMLADKRIWIFIIPDFSIVIGLYGLNLWMPQMIKALGFTNLETGFLVALPYGVAMVAMVLVGLSSDRRGERVFHVAGSALLGAAGLFGAALLSGPAAIILSFCLASAGIYAALAVFWTLPTAILRGMAAAGGLALLNSFANLGGFFGPGLMGWARERSGTYSFGLELLAGFELFACVSVILVGRAFFARLASDTL
jgi:ACS family tartrate transporter-like MFS transporter